MSEQKQKAPYPLRMPDKMRERLKALAKENDRSLNAEIVARLDVTLSFDGKSTAIDGDESGEFMTKVVIQAFDEWYRTLGGERKEGFESMIKGRNERKKRQEGSESDSAHD